jgi:hypothetical protein
MFADNVFCATNRLMEIAVLSSEYQGDIQEIAASIKDRDGMFRDLQRFEESLEQASGFFREKIKEVRNLQTLYRQSL